MAKKKTKKKAAKKPEVKEESDKAFDEADANGNGHLSKEELHNAVVNNTITLPESVEEVLPEEEAEKVPEPEEKPETKEKPEKNDRPKGAPESCDCVRETESNTHYVYKIKHDKVSKYNGQKKIFIKK